MQTTTAKDNLNKYSLAALKGGIGAIPGGSLVVELLNVTIPDRRLERIEKLLMILASRELDMDSEEIKQKFYSPEFAGIFEDVIHQTVRAISDERLEYLASVVEYGLRQEEIDHSQIKRLLEILQEINDTEVVLLQAYQESNRRNQDFRQKHSKLFDTSDLSEEKLFEHKTMLKNYNFHLINLGLIGKDRFFGSFSTFDRDLPDSNLLITNLGLMLLEKIGIKLEKHSHTGSPITAIDAIDSALNQLEQKDKKIRKELEEERKKAEKDIEQAVNRFKSKINSIPQLRSTRTLF